MRHLQLLEGFAPGVLADVHAQLGVLRFLVRAALAMDLQVLSIFGGDARHVAEGLFHAG